jgi:NAD(P)-dependent dehydrogenase (short-subunit alcohol dehydrogenase family)
MIGAGSVFANRAGRRFPGGMSSDRIALVTGASRGIGREIARGLASRGLTVYAGARGDCAGDGVEPLRLDVTDDASIAAAAERIEAEHGRLDVLVNNAGMTASWSQPSEEDPAALRATYAVNVFGVVAVTNALLPLLRRSPAARIVNLSSPLGSLTFTADRDHPIQQARLLAYNSSKAALNSITLLYAQELRESAIRVNAVNPGYVATDLNGFRGELTPEQGAATPLAVATGDEPTGTFVSAEGRLPW